MRLQPQQRGSRWSFRRLRLKNDQITDEVWFFLSLLYPAFPLCDWRMNVIIRGRLLETSQKQQTTESERLSSGSAAHHWCGFSLLRYPQIKAGLRPSRKHASRRVNVNKSAEFNTLPVYTRPTSEFVQIVQLPPVWMKFFNWIILWLVSRFID